MEVDYSKILLTLVNFVILVLLLKHFLWDKIKAVIDARESYIEQRIVEAEEESEKARIYLLENERILSTSKQEGNKIIEHKKDKASTIYNEIIADANKEARIIMSRASLEIEREKEKAQYEIKKQVVNLAIDISTKALEEKVQESKQRELINDFITKVGS